METTTYRPVLTRIDASEGCMLISKNRREDTAPYFAQTVYLGVGDSADNYEEVTEAEAREMTEQWEQSQQAQG